MNELSFDAARFSCNAELDVLLVCFLMVSGDYVLFQKGLTENAGLNKPPYFEFNDQLYGGDDVVKSCRVTRSQVIIELSQPLNGISKVRVGLSALQACHQDIIAQLRIIFASNAALLAVENA